MASAPGRFLLLRVERAADSYCPAKAVIWSPVSRALPGERSLHVMGLFE